jgi:hypothetical protein
MPALAKTLPSARMPTLRDGDDAKTLRRNLEALLGYTRDLQKQLDEAYRLLVRRTEGMMMSSPLAQRPPAGIANRIHFATDQASGSRFTFDDGTAWRSP